MKNYVVTVNGVKYSVQVEEVNGELPVQETVVSTPVTQTQPVQKTSAPVQTSAKTSVNAPMPGTVLKINVSKGQSVKKGDVLLVLEAMKMENEITSPEDGIVDVVAVNKGASVQTGDLLVGLN